jgi:hypothetical protein
MSRTRKPLNVINVDNDDEIVMESKLESPACGLELITGSTPKKIDFSTRKKGQTPKKRGLFTPMKISGDVKPKKDVKPDIRDLESLLGGLNLEQ